MVAREFPYRVLKSQYERLRAFLDFAQGFNLAVAVFTGQSVRNHLLTSIEETAALMSIRIIVVDLLVDNTEDIVRAVERHIQDSSIDQPTAVMITGMDSLIYRSVPHMKMSKSSRVPFIARLNFNREKMAANLPLPLIVWLEADALAFVLRQAPDLSQWISARFDFSLPTLTVFPVDLPIQDVTLSEDIEYLISAENEEQQNLEYLRNELEVMSKSIDAMSMRERFEIYRNLANTCFILRRFSDAERYYSRSLRFIHSLGDYRSTALILEKLGDCQLAKRDVTSSIDSYKAELDLANALNDVKTKFNAYYRLGIANSQLGLTKKAVDCLQHALALSYELKDTIDQAMTLAQLGRLVISTGDDIEANIYLRKAVRLSEIIGDKYISLKAIANLGISLIKRGGYKEAEKALEMALKRARDRGVRDIVCWCVANLGILYARHGQDKRAIHYLKLALTDAIRLKDQSLEYDIRLNLAFVYYQSAEQDKALEMFVKLTDLESSQADQHKLAIVHFNIALLKFEREQSAEMMVHVKTAQRLIAADRDDSATQYMRMKLKEWAGLSAA